MPCAAAWKHAEVFDQLATWGSKGTGSPLKNQNIVVYADVSK